MQMGVSVAMVKSIYLFQERYISNTKDFFLKEMSLLPCVYLRERFFKLKSVKMVLRL